MVVNDRKLLNEVGRLVRLDCISLRFSLLQDKVALAT